MFKDLRRTCTAIVLLVKPFVWWRSGRRCRRGLLEVPSSLQNRRISGPSAIHESAREARERARWIFLASRFARALVYRAGPPNPPVLQARSLGTYTAQRTG